MVTRQLIVDRHFDLMQSWMGRKTSAGARGETTGILEF